MFRPQFDQVCKKCKGTGTSAKEARDSDGNIMLAPVYDKKDPERPQYENCKECGGRGRNLYETPSEVLLDGEKVKLDEQDRRARFSDALAQ